MKDCIKIEDPKTCCGCGACVNVCPCDAIAMKEDESGFIYPVVDATRCVKCGLCRDVCVFCDKGVGANGAPEVYAAASK
ncbi:MAG: 4Fe-4S binding protein, partial [Clostridia bacterium]|nr:4Fe-4S binding protein [Clostridia bacterium]